MEQRNRAMILVFLLCVFPDVPAEGHVQDVCATCHTNATCDDKSDGSGKVCNCKYGFVGNGRTFCQDKDECQIGSIKICGPHTTCHNTYGSYYCTCLDGYRPTNNMAVFIPNDGTHCRDIDECSVTGLCGKGGQCRNLEGSFDCRCQLGYEVHNGEEPFNPHRDEASCEVVDCGRPVSVEDTVLLSLTGTTYSSVALFVCDEGFVWRSGDNSSVCGADGLWRGLTMVCEEVDCGSPPALPHSHMLWDKSSRMGTAVLYVCNSGYHNAGKGNVSLCTAAGQWERSSLLCQEVDCGSPPALPHSHMLWDKSSRMGTEVFYVCNSGYHNVGKGNVSLCTAAGQWERPSLLCQETMCGSPPVIESAEQVWDSKSVPGSTVLYVCKEGFYNKGGDNTSICNPNGQWTLPTLSCQEILCGDPPVLPHTGRVWNGSSTPGSAVTYYCKIGFYHNDTNNRSLCSFNGYWTKPSISCKEVDCGDPPSIPHSVTLWDQTSAVGSQVVHQCNYGYQSVGEGNVSVCTASGEWEGASLVCQVITCQEPVFKPHAKMLWDGTSHIGSVVYYQCEEGYYAGYYSLRNHSVCGENGLWEDIDLQCEEISCGPPLTLPHTNLLWDGTSRPGSVVLYECMDGFHQENGSNISTCLLSGHWGEVSVKCKAKCGPVPFLANSEVMWRNRSVVIHRCVDRYHSWRGSNMSVCGGSGVWQRASLRCIEIKPPVSHLSLLNEKCLRWRAEKYEEDTEVYKVIYTGSRDYQRSFHDRGERSLSSKADQLKICLNLLPVTNYSISITAVSSRFTATITTNTSLPVPPAPVVYYREFETPIPTLTLGRSPNTLDPISFYQVFVLPVEGIMMFNCSSPVSPDPSSTVFITAQFDAAHVGTEMNFTVGDGLHYGGVFNAPLESGRNYYIILRAVSQWKSDLKCSCVVWAKVRGTSYLLMVSSLSAAAAVGLVAVVTLAGYSFTWFFKKK